MADGYHHTQRGYLHWLILGPALGELALALSMPPPTRYWLAAIGCGLIVLAFAFRELTVRELGEALEVRFGPLPLARTRIPYEQIRSVRSERTGLIDGWGIHYIPGRGLVWNVHGRDCVRLELKNGRPFRIGTDDPEGLAAWIRQKID